MKTNQTIFIAIAATLFFTLVGCQEPKGYIELKEPKQEVVDRGIRWSVTHGLVDLEGNPIAPKEAE